jgi:hypothetical protein
MTPTLTLKQTAMECFQVMFHNGVILGEFYREVDGFYYFEPWQRDGSGYIASHVLREMADKLDEMNKAWSELIEKNLKSSGKQVKPNPAYQNAPYELRFYHEDGSECSVPTPLMRFLHPPDLNDPESLERNSIPPFILVEEAENPPTADQTQQQ